MLLLHVGPGPVDTSFVLPNSCNIHIVASRPACRALRHGDPNRGDGLKGQEVLPII